jgi:hypothetical protein
LPGHQQRKPVRPCLVQQGQAEFSTGKLCPGFVEPRFIASGVFRSRRVIGGGRGRPVTGFRVFLGQKLCRIGRIPGWVEHVFNRLERTSVPVKVQLETPDVDIGYPGMQRGIDQVRRIFRRVQPLPFAGDGDRPRPWLAIASGFDHRYRKQDVIWNARLIRSIGCGLQAQVGIARISICLRLKNHRAKRDQAGCEHRKVTWHSGPHRAGLSDRG